jgi:hypothetical protein
MQRLKRVVAIEIQTCQRCGGPLKVIASIEDRVLIERILAHLQRQRRRNSRGSGSTPQTHSNLRTKVPEAYRTVPGSLNPCSGR